MNITHVAGQLSVLSSGEYSDYRFNGLYRCRLPLDLIALCERYVDEAPPKDYDPEQKNLSDCGFGAWLIKNGWVDEVEYSEVHVGSGWHSSDFKPDCKHLPTTSETTP